MRKGKIYLFKELDYLLIFVTVACTVFGIVMISSAVNSLPDGNKYVLIQSVAAAIGFIVMAIFTAINFEKVGSAWKIIYGLCIFPQDSTCLTGCNMIFNQLLTVYAASFRIMQHDQIFNHITIYFHPLPSFLPVSFLHDYTLPLPTHHFFQIYDQYL